MATVLRVGLDTALLAVRAQLMASLGFPAERVLVCDPRALGVEHPHGDSYLWLWVNMQVPDRPRFEGAGRYDRRAVVRLEVGVRTRTALDESTSALAWATHPTLGHCALWLAVCNALDAFQPNDAADPTGASGNWLVTQPLVPAPGGRPTLAKEEKEWGETVLGYDMTIALNLDQTIQ